METKLQFRGVSVTRPTLLIRVLPVADNVYVYEIPKTVCIAQVGTCAIAILCLSLFIPMFKVHRRLCSMETELLFEKVVRRNALPNDEDLEMTMWEYFFEEKAGKDYLRIRKSQDDPNSDIWM